MYGGEYSGCATPHRTDSAITTASGQFVQPPSRPLRVLLAGGDADAAETAATVLSIHGFRVLTARDGAEASRLTAAESPDVVLLDLGMSGANGYTIDGGRGGFPVVLVAVTGHATAREKRRATEAGFDALLPKPVDLALLVGFLKNLRDRLASGGWPTVDPRDD